MIVLDTNVTSELMRPVPAPVVVAWVRAKRTSDLYTTSITMAEIRHGIERLPDGRRKELLRSTAEDVFSSFSEDVLPFDADATPAYAEIISQRERTEPHQGLRCAGRCDLPDTSRSLATRNVKDFKDTGLTVIDSWDGGQ